MEAIRGLPKNWKILGIIGDPLTHSLSPQMHNAALEDLNLEYIYIPFHVPPSQLKSAIEGIRVLGIHGVNITLPHKNAILPLLDKVDPAALQIGAVNTIKNQGGILEGRNTDIHGFQISLQKAGISIQGKKITILGAGGVACAIAHAVIKEVEEIFLINRTLSRAEKLKAQLEIYSHSHVSCISLSDIQGVRNALNQSKLLVNATSVGMWPDINDTPIPLAWIPANLTIFDTIYNPMETSLIKYARDLGNYTISGIDMLIYQGALAFEWWTGHRPNIKLMRSIVSTELLRRISQG